MRNSMRIWRAVRGEGSELGILPEPRVLPRILVRNQASVRRRGGGGMLWNCREIWVSRLCLYLCFPSCWLGRYVDYWLLTAGWNDVMISQIIWTLLLPNFVNKTSLKSPWKQNWSFLVFSMNMLALLISISKCAPKQWQNSYLEDISVQNLQSLTSANMDQWFWWHHVDVISTETGRQGGTYRTAPPLF